MYNTISAEINKYMSRTPLEQTTNPPSRCLISLNIRNMFNEISRERALDIIGTHFPQLSQLAHILLSEPTACWYMTPNGEWKYFNQKEDLPQGYPFSPILAALVLNFIITKLDVKLRTRAAKRIQMLIPLDDKEGGVTHLLAFVDDLNAVVPYEDCLYYCNTFKQLANELGLRPREDKSVILTSTNNTSPIQYLPTTSKSILKVCLKTFTKGKETTDGITMLGFPIGSKEYINNSLLRLVSKIKDTIHALKTNLNSVQTVGQLFSNSILPKFITLCVRMFLLKECTAVIYSISLRNIQITSKK